MTNENTRPSILVVEDENVVAMDLVASLEKLQYRVAGVAATGEDAIAIAEKHKPALVLMDIHLRGEMDGIQAAQQIHDRLFIPVVYLTAYSDDPTLERARITQPFGYVLKPFEDRELDVAIQVARLRHEMERALRESERRLDAILESIGEAVIATDTDHRITFLNRAAEALLGWRSDRAKGRLSADVLRVTPGVEGTLSLRRSDGDVVSIELVESTVRDTHGGVAGYVTVARDVSERLRAQEAHDRALVERAARAVVEKEHERARIKSEISLALADITQADIAVVLRRVVGQIAGSAATWCILHVEDHQNMVRLVAHADQRKSAWAEEVLRRWPPDPKASRGTYAVMRECRPELVPHATDAMLAESARDPEHLETLRKFEMTSYLCVPLRTRQNTIGALTFISSDANRRFGESDLAFAQQVADRIALAVDNGRLYRDAQAAKAEAERLYGAEQRARAEAEALFRIAEAFTETQLDLDVLVQRVTDEATALVGAEFGAFFYNAVGNDGETYRLYTLSGASKEAFERFGSPRNTPLFATTFAGRGVVRLDDVRSDPRYGKLGPYYGMPQGHLPVTSYLAVPVNARTGPVIGGLFFGHSERARFTEQHERMVKALAAHAAVAIDNAQLFNAAREGEARQKRLVGELERTVRFSEMFVGILGHDLRNPLSAIATAASLAKSRSDSDRISKPLSRILSSAERMSRMIDQILDFTHVRLGRGIPLGRQRVDLSVVCRAVIEELNSEAQEPTVRLEAHGDLNGKWDPDRLAQLISNLAGNAVQHRKGEAPALIFVDGRGGDAIVLRVENEGVIPSDILPNIFEPLRGGDPTRTAGSSGLGLGLYISQQIVAAHGGSIHAESGEGRTRFVVVLPRAIDGADAQVFGSSTGGAT